MPESCRRGFEGTLGVADLVTDTLTGALFQSAVTARAAYARGPVLMYEPDEQCKSAVELRCC